MLTLNLPSYSYHLKKDNNGQLYIWDRIRGDYFILNPEEWVRQHFVNFLITYKGVPLNLIGMEARLQYGNLTKWADVIVYDRSGKPLLMVECKASTVPISLDTLLQLTSYNHVLPTPYMALTNGLDHHYFIRRGATFEQLKALPHFKAWDNG
jgi:hypothetical protein